MVNNSRESHIYTENILYGFVLHNIWVLDAFITFTKSINAREKKTYANN